MMSDDDLAKYIVEIYFRDIARYSFKRSLNLEDTLNAYDFVRKKISERKQVSVQEIETAIRQRSQYQ